MAFEPFKAASRNAQVIHGLLLVFLFLSWVSTMVTFGSTLHTVTGYDSISQRVSLQFYWNQLHNVCIPTLGCSSYNYDNSGVTTYLGKSLSSCKSGGDATLAFAIFAFLAFLIHIPVTFCRVAGLNFPMIRDTQHSLSVETALTGVEWFCFFLQVCIWGGTCYSPSNSLPLITSSSISGQGFGLMIACFFFLLINAVFYFLMGRNDALALGNGSSRSSGAYGSEHDMGGGGGEYSSDTAQPTFSYQANPSDSQSTSL